MVCGGRMAGKLFQFYFFTTHGGTSGSALASYWWDGKNKKRKHISESPFYLINY